MLNPFPLSTFSVWRFFYNHAKFHQLRMRIVLTAAFLIVNHE